MSTRHAITALAAALLAATATTAGATEVYRYLLPDGTSRYTDTMSRGDTDAPVNAKLVETFTVPPPDSKEVESAERARRAREALRADRYAAQRVRSLDDAEAAIRDAAVALHEARAQLRAGLSPRPGERLGTAGGFSRLNGAYGQRVRALQQSVREAEADLDAALAARNALR